MRRAIAISLLLLFAWTWAAPLLARDAESTLPPCCRRHGKHHCAMMDLASRLAAGPVVTTVTERCPCRPSATTASYGTSWRPTMASAQFSGLCPEPLAIEQARALLRISQVRSHCRRGPPQSSAI